MAISPIFQNVAQTATPANTAAADPRASTSMSAAEQVGLLYLRDLNRLPDPAGQAFWEQRATQISPAQLNQEFRAAALAENPRAGIPAPRSETMSPLIASLRDPGLTNRAAITLPGEVSKGTSFLELAAPFIIPAIAIVAPTLLPSIGSALGATSAVGANALGSAVVNAGMAAVQGGSAADILRAGAAGAAGGAAGTYAGQAVGGAFPTDSLTGRALEAGARGAAGTGASTLVQTGDVSKALKAGAIGGLAGGAGELASTGAQQLLPAGAGRTTQALVAGGIGGATEAAVQGQDPLLGGITSAGLTAGATQLRDAEAAKQAARDQVISAFMEPPSRGTQIGAPTAGLSGGVISGTPNAPGQPFIDLPSTETAVSRLPTVYVGAEPDFTTPTAAQTKSDILETITAQSPTTSVPTAKPSDYTPTVKPEIISPIQSPLIPITSQTKPITSSVGSTVSQPPIVPPIIPPSTSSSTVIPAADKPILDLVGLTPDTVAPPVVKPPVTPPVVQPEVKKIEQVRALFGLGTPTPGGSSTLLFGGARGSSGLDLYTLFAIDMGQPPEAVIKDIQLLLDKPTTPEEKIKINNSVQKIKDIQLQAVINQETPQNIVRQIYSEELNTAKSFVDEANKAVNLAAGGTPEGATGEAGISGGQLGITTPTTTPGETVPSDIAEPSSLISPLYPIKTGVSGEGTKANLATGTVGGTGTSISDTDRQILDLTGITTSGGGTTATTTGTGARIGAGTGSAGEGAGTGAGLTGTGTGTGTAGTGAGAGGRGGGTGTGEGLGAGEGGGEDGRTPTETEDIITRVSQIFPLTPPTKDPRKELINYIYGNISTSPFLLQPGQMQPGTSALAQALGVGDPGASYLGKKGKERRPVWNIESLKLKDELGGDYG